MFSRVGNLQMANAGNRGINPRNGLVTKQRFIFVYLINHDHGLNPIWFEYCYLFN